MKEPMVRTTVSLPASLLAAVDELVSSGSSASRSELLAEAAAREIERRERRLIDAQFGAMATDEQYRREAAVIAAEFSSSDWEALTDEDEPR